MGLIVSLFESQFVDSSSEPTSRATEADGVKPAMASVPRNPPTYIAIPSPYFTAMSITPSPSHRLEDPFASPMLSPPLTFYTAPSSPISSPMNEDTLFFQITSMEVQSPTISSPVTHNSLQLSLPSPTQYQSMAAFPSPAVANPRAPPSPQDINQPVQSPSSDTDDAFPSVDAIDLALDEDENMESLNPLEKIYLFSISKATYHRIFICQDLPNLLDLLSPQEAVEYVLPLLHVLSRDQDEAVREALTSGLCSVIWWFLTHCQMTEEDTDSSDPPMSHPAISVDVFTPILGRLLLSPNPAVSASAKSVIVDLLKHIREADRTEKRSGTDINLPFAEDPITHDLTGASVLQEAQSEAPFSVGLFDKEKRSSFEHEILGSLIIGLEHLADTEAGVFEDCESPNDDEDQLREGIQEWRGTVKIAEDEAMESPVKALPFSASQKSDNINPYFPVLSGQSEDLRPAYSPTATSSTSSTTASTPSSTASAVPSSSSTSPDGNTLSAAVENPVPVLASPPSRLPIPSHTLHSARPASPSYLSFSASPKSSPRHQVTDPFSALPAAFLQRSSSPANQCPRSPSPQAPPLAAGVSHSLYNEETVPSTGVHTADATPDDQDIQEIEEQAAVKRMASISLMAMTTSQGCVEPSSQITFIQPIERFSADPVPWVRRESSFAISALAKTVPDELVHMSLLPLLENLMGDSIPHVRHSSLFALPSVLARLPLKQRQTFALHAVNTLAMDPSDDVRSGLLDSLGEILYTFYSEDGSNDAGPPEELIWMFTGRRSDIRRRDGQQPFDRDKIDKLASFYQDRARPLICAFNFPAVAKSLGPSKWDSILRDMYIRLANNPAFGVRRTLAASVGELARILGPEKAERDLMGVWRDAINGQDEEIRTKTVDCLGVLFDALGPAGRREVLEKVLEVWTAKRWKGWRERETIALTFMTIIESIQSTKMDVTGHAAALCGLVIQALLDNVSAIREAALNCLPRLWSVIQRQPSILDRFRLDIQSFSQSDASRKRMTYVACLQVLLLPPRNGQALVSLADELSWPLRSLARDSVIGVRIGVARLLGHLYADQSIRNGNSTRLVELVMLFSQETSREVMLYVPDLSNSLISSSHGSTSCSTRPGQESVTKSAIFSRPPLCSIGEKCPTEPR